MGKDYMVETIIPTSFAIDICDVGQEPSEVGCADCRVGYYSSSNSSDACVQCPGSLTTTDVASTALTDCRGNLKVQA